MKVHFTIIFITICSLAIAQVNFDNYDDTDYLSFSNYFNQSNNLTSPSLDLSKLSMGHSLSFSSSFSSNNIAGYQSMYTNHMQYKFSPKLNLQVNLNFVNYGTSNFNNKFNFKSNNDNQSNVLPEFNLEYKPSENTTINIIFQQRRYNGYLPYRSGFKRW